MMPLCILIIVALGWLGNLREQKIVMNDKMFDFMTSEEEIFIVLTRVIEGSWK